MKKDFTIALFLSLFLLFIGSFPLRPRVAAWRRLAFYFLYPTSTALANALRHAEWLGAFWGEILKSQQKLEEANASLADARVAAFEMGLVDAARLGVRVPGERAVSGALSFSFERARISYRGTSPREWVSGACLQMEGLSPAPWESPIVFYNERIGDFVLVGRVLRQEDAFGLLPCVQFLTSPDFNLLARVERTSEFALLRGVGDPQKLLLDYLPSDAQTKLGDRVFSAANSLIVPKDIFIGEIVELPTPNVGALFSQAIVKPAFHVSRLEEVLVLKWSNPWRK